MSDVKEKSVKTYSGARISSKEFKRYLASASTPKERQAIKNLYLSEPVKVFAKNTDVEEAVVTDIPKQK